MPKLWCVAVGAPCLLLLTSCVDFEEWADSDRYKEDFHESYPINAGGTLSVDNTNGSVDITSWEQNTVEVNGTKYASTKSLLNETKVDISATAGSVRIRTLRPSWSSHGGSGVRYSIRVPKRIQLDEISSTNGPIRIEMIEGNVRAHTTNGGIRLYRVKGEVNVRSTNGRIETQDIVGNIRARTTNGPIEADASEGTFEAATTNGKIEARLVDPSPGWPLKAETTNGHIELTLKGSRLPDVRAETHNSSIVLHLPASANARVRAETSRHSSITSDFDVSTHGGTRGRSELDGTIGSGGPLLELSTRNGSIKILKL